MPKKPLTDKFVASVKPSNEVAQVDYFDKGYPALALRVGRREKVWTFHHREQGELKRKKLGRYPEMTLAEAREAWRMCRKALAEGTSITTSASGVLVESAVAQWFEAWQRDKREHTIKAVRLHCQSNIVPAWQGRDIASIQDVDALSLLDGIAARGAGVQARRVYATLQMFFGWCIKRKLVITDPMRAIEKKDFGRETARERVLSDAELGKLLGMIRGVNEYNPYFTATYLLALTGCRTEEIGALRWDEINGDTIELPAARMKNGLPFDLPVTKQIAEALASVPRFDGCPYVFTTNGRTPIKKWDRAKRELDACGVTDWQLRDLRRTMSTGLQKLKFPEDVIDAATAHVKTGVKRVYQRHKYIDEKRSALDAWGTHLASLI
jgi:integrase